MEKVILVDDINGATKDVERVYFNLDGVNYEIDLSEPNAKALREIYAPYVEKGRKKAVTRKRGSKAKRNGTGPGKGATTFFEGALEHGGESAYAITKKRREELNKVRQWAREQGMKIASHGRISQDVFNAYYSK